MLPEEKVLHGWLQERNDGFSYVHGKHKGGRKKRPRNAASTARQVRTHKRSVKAKSLKRMMEEI